MTWLETAGWLFSMLGFGWHVRHVVTPRVLVTKVQRVEIPMPLVITRRNFGGGTYRLDVDADLNFDPMKVEPLAIARAFEEAKGKLERGEY